MILNKKIEQKCRSLNKGTVKEIFRQMSEMVVQDTILAYPYIVY